MSRCLGVIDAVKGSGTLGVKGCRSSEPPDALGDISAKASQDQPAARVQSYLFSELGRLTAPGGSAEVFLMFTGELHPDCWP
jgi:hypothetical protein